jgi:hypothetical protein
MQTSLGYLLNEPTPKFWTSDERTSWINEGQNDIANKLVDDVLIPLIVPSSVATSVGVNNYSLTTLVSDNYLRIKDVSVDGVYYRPLSIWDVNALNNSFYAGGTKDQFWYFLNNKIYISPTPTAMGTITVTYIKLPTALSAPTDTSVVPVVFHQYILLYALHLGWIKAGKPVDATSTLNLYHSHIQAINARYMGLHQVEQTDESKRAEEEKK